MCWFLSVYLGLRTCSDSTTPSYLDVSGWRCWAGWQGGCWEIGTCYAVSIMPSGSCLGEAWLEGLLCGPAASCSSCAAPAGPASQAKKRGCGATFFHAFFFFFAKVRHSSCKITPETATEQSILEIDLQRNTLAAGLLLDIQISWFPFVCTSFTASSYLLRSVLTRSLQAV